MARRILNRKELREEAGAQEQVEEGERVGVEEDTAEEEKKKKPAAKAVRRKARAKPSKEVRLKAFWGVFSQTLNQVAQYEYSQREEAAKKAQDLSDSRKSPHFVQLVKKVIEE